MASLMPCNGPKACPCPVGRCAPRGVASSVHTSSQFAGLRNRPVSPPLPAPYEHTPNYPRPRPAGRDLVLKACPVTTLETEPWATWDPERACPTRGEDQTAVGVCGHPSLGGPSCLAFTKPPTPRCYFQQVLGDPCLHPAVVSLLNSSSVHKHDLGEPADSQNPRVLSVPFDAWSRG